MKTITVILITVLAGLGGCGEKRPPASLDDAFYFSGIYHWNEETPFLKDAATGAEFPVVNLADDPEFLRFLVSSTGEQPRFVYVELMGHLQEGSDGLPDSRILQADSLLEVFGSPNRRNEETVAGFYVTDQAGQRATLLLNGSYGFRQVRFGADSTEAVYTGVWRQSARNRVILFYQQKDGEVFEAQQTIGFDPDNLRLVEQAEGKQVIYRKTYL